MPWLNWMFDLIKNHVVPVGKTYQCWWCGRFERSRCSSRSYPEPIHVTLSFWSCHLINQCSFLRKLNHPTLSSKNPGTEGIGLSMGMGGACFFFVVLGFEFLCVCLSFLWCLTCSLGLQGVQWTVRLFMVRASWPGHPHKKKKNPGTCLRIFVEN